MASIFDECLQLALPDELEIMRSTLHHLSEGVVVADTKGRFLICNNTARSVLGIATGSGTPHDWSEVRGCYKTDGQTPYPADELPSTRALASGSEALKMRTFPGISESLSRHNGSSPLTIANLSAPWRRKMESFESA